MPTKTEIIEAERLAQLRAFVPAVFGPGTLLYIGASVLRAQCLPELLAAGRQVTILEAWPANADHYRGRKGLRVVCGDVRQVATLKLPRKVYDVAFWWHGPEHVTRAELPATLAALEARARLVVLAGPWGDSPQGAVFGNGYEIHQAALEPATFQALGYRTSTLGQPGGRSRSNIIAVKDLEDSWTS